MWQDSLSTTQSGTAQFTITEYSKRKQFDNYYYSPPFTTSPQGYRLCLTVDANGHDSGNGSHLSIFAIIMKGQHVRPPPVAFHWYIIIELLNWLEDKGHYKMTISIDTNNDFVRVTKGVVWREYQVMDSSSPSPLSTHPLTHNTFTRTVFA